MSIEKMTLALEDGLMGYGPGDGWVLVPVKTANAIAKVLRAGQAMRDSIGVSKHMKKDGSAIFRTADVIDGMAAVQAADSWDAATKEGEG